MGYAVRKDGLGWRAVDSKSDIMECENYSETHPPTTVFDNRIYEIKSRLAQIDIDSVRPLRAIIANTATQHDIDKLSALDEEAVLLREELSTYTN